MDAAAPSKAPAPSPERPFLSAEWRNLVMVNYEIDPATLAPLLPRGCVLDSRAGRVFVSVVGFQFFRTRVRGVPILFHQNFEEVNLRFYVRREAAGTWRRGVVFVRELVPRRAIAWVARWVYGENYVALPMRHEVDAFRGEGRTTASYEWRRRGVWEGLRASFFGTPALAPEESDEAFITEHYWGYAGGPSRVTLEYQVEHPRWRVWQAETASLECDVASLYGPEYVEALSGRPGSAFVAEGSPVLVRRGRPLA